jgi:cyanophycinase
MPLASLRLMSPALHHSLGPLALVGGGEWADGCTFDKDLLVAAGGGPVVILPTAAAYEQPALALERAERWFASIGATVRGLMVLGRQDGMDATVVDAVREARFVYLSSGSPLHLRSVLKESPLFEALGDAWRAGAVLAGSGAGAMVLGDPMVDPRGGAFTLGLGLVEGLAVLPQASTWSHERLRRTISLAPPGLALVALDEQTAVIRSSDGAWTAAGIGQATVYVGGKEAGLEALPG